MKKISLYFKEGSSDKEYHLQILQVAMNAGYVVNFQYGRRGGPLKADTKTPKPVTYEEAEKIFDRKVKEQIGKGYHEGETKSSYSGDAGAKPKQVIIAPQLLNSIEEEEVDRYINDASWLAQEKHDGERRLILSFAPTRTVTGLNKKGTEVQLPDNIIDAVIGIDCIIDGEIVGDQFFAFDLLSKAGMDYSQLSCRERIANLGGIKFGRGIYSAYTAYTPKEKLSMYNRLLDGNKEGIVFKNKLAAYTSGRPASGGNALKYKFVKTATFIVGEITTGKRSVGLLLVDDTNDFRFMGKVTIPANHEIPAAGDLVEVRYLYAYKDGCVFQPVYLGKRPDSDITDATINQIIYKQTTEV